MKDGLRGTISSDGLMFSLLKCCNENIRGETEGFAPKNSFLSHVIFANDSELILNLENGNAVFN